jgi:hypothetical protein
MSENKSAKELNTALKELWNSLTEEQKEKANQCKSLEELTALAGKLGVELPDEMLEAVAGGIRFNDRSEFERFGNWPPNETFLEYQERKKREQASMEAEGSC